MTLMTWGLNHWQTPLQIREKAALSERQLEQALAMAARSPYLDEAVLLSTCNRMEAVLVAPRPEEGTAEMFRILEAVRDLNASDIAAYIQERQGKEAVAHLFRLTGGLDSMVPGETQIQGQVKSAYEKAMEIDTVGPAGHGLMRQALSCGKRIQHETAINHSAASISYAAVELACHHFASLEGLTVVVFGLGEMGALAARYLREAGAENPVVANRNVSRAREVADQVGGQGVSSRDLASWVSRADILISSTGAPHPVLDASWLEATTRIRQIPLFCIDIAVPRDITPEAGNLPTIRLFNIDDLQEVVSRNLDARREEAAQAEAIVQEEVEDFLAWYRTLEVAPVIADLRHRAEELRSSLVDKALEKKLHDLDQRQKQQVDQLTRSLVNRILREPILELKAVAQEGQARPYRESLRRLFQLYEEERQ